MNFEKPIFDHEGLIVSGHRGDITGKDENTMAAFRRAVACGCDMVETDVHMTKDGKIVLRHDSLIEGLGRIEDCDYDALLRVKPDLPLLEELAILADETPGLGLLIELKQVPPSAPGNGLTFVKHPAPYTGDVPECTGKVYGPEPGKLPNPEDLIKDRRASADDLKKIQGKIAEEDRAAFLCAEKTCELLIAHGLQNRVWILSFSGKLLEYVYGKYGKTFHYHAFYPWFIQGDMTLDPADFCEMVCMQHRYLTEDGRVIRYEDPVCPESWWKDVLDRKMIPIGAPSLKTMDNFREAIKRGCRMINANDPVAIIKEFRQK